MTRFPNPFALSDPFGFAPRAATRASQSITLTPEEEASLIGEIGSSALSGLSYVGETLDKPGRAIRGLLGGKPEELLNLLPFSDTLGITDPADSISGRDLLESAGVLGANTEGFDFGDVAGFGAEVLLDPLTYLTFGASAALGAGGKAAKGAGLLDDAVRVASKAAGKHVGKRASRLGATGRQLISQADEPFAAARKFVTAAKKQGKRASAIADEPLGGLLGVGLPFQDPLFTLGKAGGLGGKIARGLDVAGEAVRFSPPGRAVAGLFHSPAGGKFDKFGQQIAEETHRGFPEGAVKAKESQFKALDELNEAFEAFDESFGGSIRAGTGETFGGSPFSVGDIVQTADRGNFGRVIGATEEGASVFLKNPETGATATKTFPFDELSLAHGSGTSEAQGFALDQTRKVFDDIVRMTAETGLSDAFDEFLPGISKTPTRLTGAIASASENMKLANASIYADIQAKGGKAKWLGGPEDLQHFPRYVDPRVRKEGELIASRVAPTSFGSTRPRTVETRLVPAAIANRLLRDGSARGEGAAKHILENYTKWLDEGVEGGIQAHATDLADWVGRHSKSDLYTRSTLQDFLDYQLGAHRVSKSLDAIHEVIRRNLGTDEGIDLAAAYKAAHMNPEKAIERLAEVSGESVESLRGMSLPAEVVQAMVGVNKVLELPEWMTQVGDAIKSFNRIWKASVTLPFPAFFARNFTSGQGVNMMSGLITGPGDLAIYGRSFKQAAGLMKKNADPALLRELELYDIASGKIGFQDVDLFTPAGKGIQPTNPLAIRETFSEAAQAVGDVPLSIDRVPGTKAIRKGFRTVVGTGGKANRGVEWLNRVPMYLYLKQKGWSPLQAARKVKELQFDYSDLAPAELALRNTLIPFYTFTRKISELTFRTLAERPGGLLAQNIRAAGNLRGEDAGLIPDFISQGLSIPLGETPGGADRFITGFGQAHEDPLSFVGGGLSGAGLEGLSRLNPLIKAPLEIATDQSFFQRGPGGGGRRLGDLDPLAGRLAANVLGRDEPVNFGGLTEQVLSNSPLSRALSTAKGLTDRRPGRGIFDSPGGAAATGTNLLTGVRITDVQQRTKDALLRERIEGLLKKHPGAAEFTKVFVSREAREKLPPEERAAVEQLMALNALLASKARARREAAKQ